MKKKITNGVLTLGNFDGIHLGHQEILKKVALRAKSLRSPSIVYTFNPHPVKVVAPHKDLPLITTLEDKANLIKNFNIDHVVLAKFTKEFASLHPDEFVKKELVKRLKVREVWVGHDFAFGRAKLGTIDYLACLGRRYGFKVNVMPAVRKRGLIVSSSRIRRLVLDGDVKMARSFLGRFYLISGRVIKGKNRGKKLGFPTANIETENELIPKRGVYAVFCEICPPQKKRAYKVIQKEAAVNIGANPTFGDGGKLNIEAHVIDFDGNLYNKNIRIHFVQRIRDELKFSNPIELSNQIERDIYCARRLLWRKRL